MDIKENRNLSLGFITNKNIYNLKLLVEKEFPVEYSDEFYQLIHLKHSKYSRFGYFKDNITGGISGRVEKDDNDDLFLNLMLILVFERYKKLGLGSKMLNFCIDEAKKNNLKYIKLYVQSSNKKAIEFYKKHNFEIISTEEYYKDITDKNASLMKLIL